MENNVDTAIDELMFAEAAIIEAMSLYETDTINEALIVVRKAIRELRNL